MPDRDATRNSLTCYRCGASLESLTLPLSRRDLCPGCSVELHVCRMCRHYAPSAPDACDEEDAEEVRNKTTSNFCDYFSPSVGSFDGKEQQAEEKARSTLDSLFEDQDAGSEESPSDTDPALRQAEDLFRK